MWYSCWLRWTFSRTKAAVINQYVDNVMPLDSTSAHLIRHWSYYPFTLCWANLLIAELSKIHLSLNIFNANKYIPILSHVPAHQLTFRIHPSLLVRLSITKCVQMIWSHRNGENTWQKDFEAQITYMIIDSMVWHYFRYSHFGGTLLVRRVPTLLIPYFEPSWSNHKLFKVNYSRVKCMHRSTIGIPLLVINLCTRLN